MPTFPNSKEDHPAPLKPESGKIKLRILVDRSSVEVFSDDGRVYLPCGAIHPEDNRTRELYAKGGEARAVSPAKWANA